LEPFFFILTDPLTKGISKKEGSKKEREREGSKKRGGEIHEKV